jgi:glycosyltransferase involved in cell wall biosynthesis
MRKSLFIIGSTGIPARYGGFETFAENISLKLRCKHDVTVICSKRFYAKEERHSNWKNIQRIFIPFNPNGISSLFYDLLSLIYASRNADSILILGSGCGIYLPFFTLIRNVQFAVHIDGIEWKRSKWNLLVRIFLRISTSFSVKYANYVLIDNKALLKYISVNYANKVIPTGYGGDHLPSYKTSMKSFGRPFAFSIARAEPENNLHLILEAFVKIEEMDLVIISDWKKNKYGRKLFARYNNHKNMILSGPIYNDLITLQEYRKQCHLYVHGHSAGGTNPSLVEAMYSGIPVIAFDNEFNRITTNNLAHYFSNIDDLVKQILTLTSEQLKKNAGSLQKYAFKHYTWDNVMKSLDTMY